MHAEHLYISCLPFFFVVASFVQREEAFFFFVQALKPNRTEDWSNSELRQSAKQEFPF